MAHQLDPAPCPRNFACSARAAQAHHNLDSHLLRIFARSLGAQTPPGKSDTIEPQGAQGFRIRTERGEVVFVATGIGMKRAQAIARQALAAMPETRLVIATGVVGALSGGSAPRRYRDRRPRDEARATIPRIPSRSCRSMPRPRSVRAHPASRRTRFFHRRDSQLAARHSECRREARRQTG